MSSQRNLRSLTLDLPGSIISLTADILTKAINNLTEFEAPDLNFSGSQIKSIFHDISMNDSCRIRHLNLSFENDFSLVDLRMFRAVNQKLTEINDFKRFLCVNIVEMSIKELLKYEEEGEEKLSDEELCQRWNQFFCEAWETAQSLPSCNSMDAFLHLRQRLQRVLTTNSVSHNLHSSFQEIAEFLYGIQ